MNSSGMVSNISVAFIYSADFAALLAAVTCSLGIFLIGGLNKPGGNQGVLRWKKIRFVPGIGTVPHSAHELFQRSNSHRLNKSLAIKILTFLSSSFAAYLITVFLTRSITISSSIACLASAIPFIVNRSRERERVRRREIAWPEAIDSLVSALQSGIPIPEAVLSLSHRGPVILQPIFIRIQHKLLAGEEFSQAVLEEKARANSAISDQVFETLILAKDFGGKDSNTALRLLAEFIREDLAVAEEIRTRFGWVKNSAALATAAPWILLILLSSQSSSREAFASYEGIKVLILGILMTASAYIWMERVGALPSMPRALR